MNINDAEYALTVFAMKGILMDLNELQDDAMDKGDESLEFILCTAERLIESALNIISRQQEEIDRLQKAAKEMLEE
ncbi:TPA: hypothetical protein ACU0GY_005576 [Escherichia coli]